jgi:hypothetical protein
MSLLKELTRAGFLITSCDRASGFIGVTRPSWNSVGWLASILVQRESDSASAVIVGAANLYGRGFRTFMESRGQQYIAPILRIVASLR